MQYNFICLYIYIYIYGNRFLENTLDWKKFNKANKCNYKNCSGKIKKKEKKCPACPDCPKKICPVCPKPNDIYYQGALGGLGLILFSLILYNLMVRCKK